MAEKVLFNIAEGIISSVAGPLAAEEVKLFLGVKKELKKLKNTVSTINAVLLDAEEQQVKSHLVSDWLGKLTDILYEADDLLNAVSTNALRRELMVGDKMAKKVRLFFSKSNPLVCDHRMAHKIKVIREALDAIAVDMRNFDFVPRLEETAVRVTGRDSNSVMPEYEVVGRDVDTKKIIEQLVGTNVQENVSVLPIVGIGGLGKTTLAQQAYNAEKIKTHFELRMWICVSDPFNVEDIVGKILESVEGKKAKSMDVMIKNLHEKINGKKYFLVLDDVWNENPEQWSKLKRVLVGGATGSKILVTTPSEKVAKIMFQGEPYFLESLGDEASLNLFKQMTFPKGEWPENPKFLELGREILRKCAGVPLAVRTLGRMLHLKNSEVEWLNFVKNDLPDIEKDEFDILSTLRLSYNKLPSYLKHCFAYCSMYPKDHVYNKTLIIKEWIAHGFVEASPTNQCLEDVGNNYFMDLLWRSFFQDPKENKDHVVIGCKMHDLMHDLATSVMTSSLITTFDTEDWKINKKTRHLAVCGGLDFSIKELILHCEGGLIRTFLCPNFKGEIDYEVIFSSFKFLRVLNLSRNNLEHVPNTIGQLKHLRYLDLSWNKKIKVLPCTCTKLVNLQFLNLYNCEAFMGLPRGIKNLVNLRILTLDHCSKMTYFSHGLRKSTSLQWLKQFWVDSNSPSSDNASLSEFKELNKLGGRLIIWNLGHSKDDAIEYKASNIKEKTGLKALMLHFSSSDEDHGNDIEDERILEGLQPHINLMRLEMDSYRSVRLPSWILSISSLEELRLYKCNNCQYLPHVNQLRSLKLLYLTEMNALTYISDDSRGEFSSSSSTITENSFPSLSKIHFEICLKLKGWWRNSSSVIDHGSKLPLFSQLSKVWIKNCPMLISLPLSPQLCLLEELHLEKMDTLEYLFDDDRSQFSSSSLAFAKDFFSSLSKIHFEECLKLKGWWRNSSLEVDSDSKLLLFPQLSKVWIKNCPMLTSLPLSLQLCLLEELHLEKMDTLEYLFDDDKSQFSSPPLALAKDFFSSLSIIHFEKCPKLKGWWRKFCLEVDHDSKPPLFPQLSKVWIENCPMLTSLPLSPQLQLLKEVFVYEIDSCEYVYVDDWCDSSESTEAFLPSLSKIWFKCCPNLKGWWRDSLEINCTLPLFPKLSVVNITTCPLLTYPPLSPHIKRLELEGCSGNLLEPIMMVKMLIGATNSTISGSSYASLSKLKKITLEELLDLETLQEEWLKNLTSLKDLTIYDCLKLKSLSSGIQHLTALKNLSLSVCPELESLSDDHGKCWEGLKSLIYLRVNNLLKWVSLPLGLQQVSTLQELEILDCENLTIILESIHHWKSLKKIRVWNCPGIIELPEGIQNLSSLQKLEISGCSKLKSLSSGIQHLIALKSLIIGSCPELEPPNDEHGMCWENLKSLLVLRIVKLSKWVSLPLGLQQVSTLRMLYISECESLTTILESIHCWKSLEMLGISNCPCLRELPEGIQSLSSLQRLLIRGCPILLQKYNRDEGVDWRKIAYIPMLELDSSQSKEKTFERKLSKMKHSYLYGERSLSFKYRSRNIGNTKSRI